MQNQLPPNDHVRLKPSDLRLKHQCQQCQQWHTAHALPWGAPLAFLVTGYCPKCGASYLSLRQGSEKGVSGAAQQLSDYFRQFTIHDHQDMNTRH